MSRSKQGSSIKAQPKKDMDGPRRMAQKPVDAPDRAHNPKVAGSNPAPATN